MSYASQSNVSTGDLIDATIWNQSLANDQAIRAGGIAIASQAAQDIVYASSSTQLARLGYGTSGYFLKTLGSGSPPAWAAVSAVAGSDTQVQFNDGGSTMAGDSGLVFNKTSNLLTAGGVAISGTGASSLDVGGGINAGTGDVALVGTDGKIEGPLSSTVIDDLSAANLTHLNLGQANNSGTVATARLGSGTANSSTFLRGDSSWAAAGGALEVLHRAAGNTTNNSAENAATYAVSGLAITDQLVIFQKIYTTATTAGTYLYNATDSVNIRKITGDGTVYANAFRIAEYQMGCNPLTVTWIGTRETDGDGAGGGGGTVQADKSTFSTDWTGSWTIAIRHAGVGGSGTFYWSWVICKLAGE